MTVAQDEFDSNPSIENKGKMTRCLYEYRKVLQMEETFWKQKSRVQWPAEGNRNTKFFHIFALVRRNTNKNTMLKNSDGIWLRDEKDIEDHIVTHFEALFTDSGWDPRDDRELCQLVPNVITSDENVSLTRMVTTGEIKKALSQLGALKVPGPDGFQGIFFSKYWDQIGPNVCEMIT